MNVTECLKTRRSIRKYTAEPVDHSVIDSIVSLASYSPSWKDTQITRCIAIEDTSLLTEIAETIPRNSIREQLLENCSNTDNKGGHL